MANQAPRKKDMWDYAPYITLLKKKFFRMFCFVHDDELRECYNTYERVERLASKGYQSMNERGF